MNTISTSGADGVFSPEPKPKKPRKKKKDKAAVEGGVTPGAVESLAQENLYETFTLQLKQLPPVPLMEPHVGNMHAMSSPAGASHDAHGKLFHH